MRKINWSNIDEGQKGPLEPVISCHEICVEIPVYSSANRSFRHTILKKLVGGPVSALDGVVIVKALDSVSFDVYLGDSVGILGHNGSGKTTLLKVLAGIYEPTAGTIKIHGKTTPYFGVNEGITPEMTGYEAIVVGALVRGVRHKDIPGIIEEVENFAELGDFLNLPIRTYSSGMNARLMFAIATCIPPEILLVDENIGAGDERFQEKVRVRVKDYISKASTFFLASHNPIMMGEWCKKGLLLRQGRVLFWGDISEAIRQYNHGSYLPEPHEIGLQL
ncbi:MAG: ABC transporter ATP-binding protein [Deltaproteobacteria bacterium]|nr:ABC transporter ATP-binding protein [Deltaproteobacteria bacterium]